MNLNMENVFIKNIQPSRQRRLGSGIKFDVEIIPENDGKSAKDIHRAVTEKTSSPQKLGQFVKHLKDQLEKDSIPVPAAFDASATVEFASVKRPSSTVSTTAKNGVDWNLSMALLGTSLVAMAGIIFNKNKIVESKLNVCCKQKSAKEVYIAAHVALSAWEDSPSHTSHTNALGRANINDKKAIC